MIRIAAVIILLAAFDSANAVAQSRSADEAAILAVVDRFMVAVSTSDSKLMAELHLEGAIHMGVRTNESGGTTMNRRVMKPLAANPAAPSVRRERYWDPVVHVRGSIAIVWTPYEYWRDGKTTHCGIDVFDMVKQDGTWRIAGMMWTVEPDACTELRPSDPARIRPEP